MQSRHSNNITINWFNTNNRKTKRMMVDTYCTSTCQDSKNILFPARGILYLNTYSELSKQSQFNLVKYCRYCLYNHDQKYLSIWHNKRRVFALLDGTRSVNQSAIMNRAGPLVLNQPHNYWWKRIMSPLCVLCACIVCIYYLEPKCFTLKSVTTRTSFYICFYAFFYFIRRLEISHMSVTSITLIALGILVNSS